MATDGLILDMDWDISKAEAKQRKLEREFDISKQKADNIKNEMQQTVDNIEQSKKRQKQFNDELDRSSQKLDAYLHGQIQLSDKQVQAETKRNAEIQKRIEKEQSYQATQEKSLIRQESSLNAQNAKTANIGDQILSNTKKQNKFSQAFEKSQKSADRFGRRLKSLIASALFFSVVTKAFTALRNEFGKLITETGTKTASLVAQLNGSLAVLGRTLYEGARPYIEWILQKLIQMVNVITYGIAKMLGKSVEEMKKLAQQTKKTGKEAKGALASFDQVNTISSGTDESDSGAGKDFSKIKDPDDDTVKKLKEILALVTAIGIGFAAWKIGGLLTDIGILSGKVGGIVKGIGLIVIGASLLFTSAVNWNDELHNGENTLNAIIGTLGTILVVIGLIIAGVVAWPVLIVGALAILGMWFDNYKDKIDKWINSLPVLIYELVDIIYIAAYGVWDFLKNLFKGLYEIFTGDWEKGLKRIGIALVNLLVDALNIVIQAINFILWPIRELIVGIGKIAGKNWNVKDVAIPKIPRIPQLATGAILPGGSPMLAWVNDQPKGQPYVEGSIENIAAAFEKYLSGKNFGSGEQNITVPLYVDGREIARATRSGENKLGNQTVFGGFANVY